jgi:two-component sensor histidine kinase/ABC-type amino acid transport substrate-binding protein
MDGFLDHISMKYFKLMILQLLITVPGYGDTIDSLLTSQENQWIQDNNIRYTPNPSWPPGDFIDDQGVHRGIIADYIQLFERELGISFEKIIYNNWNEIVEGLQTGEADFVGAMQQTDDREEFLLFTEPLIQVPNVILIRSDYPYRISADHINNMEIAGVTGYASMDYMRNTFQGVRMIEFDDDLTALLQTSLGNTDGVIVDMMTASYLVEKYGITNLQLGKTLDFDWELRIASRNDLPELHSILNKLLASIDEIQRDTIFNKWVDIDYLQEAGFIERNQTRLILLTFLLFIVGISITYHNYDLKKQVKNRTNDLERELEEKSKIEKNLKKSIEEKEVLLAEIHHRVKNNLAITSSLFQLEMMHVEEDKIVDLLSNSVMRIKSIAMVHEKLYESKDFKSIPFHVYLTEILPKIENKYNFNKRIKVHKDVDIIHLNINLAIPAALLINELVTNSFKHAFPDQNTGVIVINLKSRGDKVQLSVEDDGIGLPEFIDPEDRSSVGFMLINTLSKQLNVEGHEHSPPKSISIPHPGVISIPQAGSLAFPTFSGGVSP